jgi:hypothetical protein
VTFGDVNFWGSDISVAQCGSPVAVHWQAAWHQKSEHNEVSLLPSSNTCFVFVLHLMSALAHVSFMFGSCHGWKELLRSTKRLHNTKRTGLLKTALESAPNERFQS